MSFGDAIISGLRNYFKFSGRTPRSGLWFFVLFSVLVGIAAAAVDFFLFPSLFDQRLSPVSSIAQLVLFIPSITIWVRRLHDTDRSGWWFLIAFTLIGWILLIVWACKRGTPGKNRFGPDPLANI